MLCWSCGKNIPDTAKRCQFCEAVSEPEPLPEELDAAGHVLQNLNPDALAELQAIFDVSENGEDFVNRIMVGECPACASKMTTWKMTTWKMTDVRMANKVFSTMHSQLIFGR